MLARLALAALALFVLSGCDFFLSPEARLERARVQIEQGNRRAALVELKNALEEEPELHEARLLLADVAVWLGDPVSAEAELQKIPADLDPAFAADVRARAELMLGRSEALLEHLSNVQDEMSPARRDMYEGLALLQLRREPAQAQAKFESAIRQDPALVPAKAGLIQALAMAGEIERALEASKKFTQAHPDSAELWYAHGLLLARSDYKAAIAALERARDLAPKQLDVLKGSLLLSQLIEMQLASGRLEDAKVTNGQLARVNPGSPLAQLMASRVAMASNDYVTATADLRRLVNSAPTFHQARFMLGVALAAQGNLEQASQELAQVVEEAPEFLEARQLLGQVRMRLDDPDGALRVLVPGLESEGASIELGSLIDAARAQAGGDAKSIDILERAWRDAPDNISIAVQLAAAYLQADQPAKAVATLRQTKGTDPRREALLLEAILRAEGLQATRAELDRLLASHPTDPRTLGTAATFLARVGEVDRGRKLLQAELAKAPGSPELGLALAQFEWAVRQPQAARNALRQVLDRNPTFAAGRLALAEVELAGGRIAEAKQQLQEASKLMPDAPGPRLMLARLALRDENASDAAAFIDEALEVATADAPVHAQAGRMYLDTGRYDQAIQHLRAALDIDSTSAPWWLDLGRAQLALDQHALARESFERALSLKPNWIAAEGALVFLELQLRDNDAALARLESLKRARPQDAAVAALEGQALVAMRRQQDAVAAFDRAYQLRPSGAVAANSYWARLAANAPRPTELLERWVAQNPRDIAYRGLLAEAYTRAGERKLAIEQYEHIVREHPQNARALNNLAWLYYEMKDPRALATARRASAAAPSAATVSDTLGWILAESGQAAEAVPILERAAAQSDDPEIAFHYGVALLRAGSRDKGMAQLQQLLKDHPVFPSRAAAERLLRGGESASL
ncbi:MAG TPA: XrtA/PEP-CTERM system TPR-repeat protein PrsT [Steroidobacter sp.]